MKNRIFVGIIMVLMLLVLPATASDYTLDIFGNANEDETINMQDVTYTELIILEYKEATDLADAKYDGEIDILDVTQIELIILGQEKEITITDSTDRVVTIEKPVERVIIAYWIDAAMTLKVLNAEDTVVGVTDVVKDEPILFPELSELPSVGIGPIPDYLDYEKLLELGPDLVLTGGNSMDPTSHEVIIERIHSLNPDIRVLCFTFCLPSLYAEEVRKTGYIFDRREEADEIISFIDGHLSEIEEKVRDIPADERTEVYYEFFRDYYTSGDGTAYSEYIEMAGGKNVFGDLPGYADYYLAAVDPEAVIVRNPEVILCHPGMGIVDIGYQADDVTKLRDKRAEIMNRPGFDAILAVESGRVYTCHSNIILSAIYPVGVAYYAKWFYPERFEDLDPNAIHQEYLERFLRIDFDLDEHGVFVYHPEQHPDGR